MIESGNSRQIKMLDVSTITNKYLNQGPCFIIGNGASLLKQDLSSLRNYHTIVSNAYGVFPAHEDIVPTLYCIADPGYGDEKNYINHQKFFSKASKNCEYTTLISTEAINHVAMKYGSFRRHIRIRFNPNGDLSCIGYSRKSSIQDGLPQVQSVSQMMIMVAIIAGFTEIYLIGMDHDWIKFYDVSKGDAPHFYLPNAANNVHGETNSVKENTLIKPKLNSVQSQKPTFYTEILSMKKLWEGYHAIYQEINRVNIKLINSTEGGFLDVFERRSILPLRKSVS